MSNIDKIKFKITYCGSWFTKLVEQLQNHLTNKYDAELFEFINNPVKVPLDEPKPYKIEINDTIVYCINNPIDQESKPIIFEQHKYFGEPDLDQISKLENKIENSINTILIKKQVNDINSMVEKLLK